MTLKSFSEQNALLKEKLSDPSLFETSSGNFLKLVQHGVLYANNADSSKLIRNYLTLPVLVVRMIYRLKRWRNTGKGNKPKFQPSVALEVGRTCTDQAGGVHSIYFERISKVIGRNNLSIIQLKPNSDIPGDFTLSELKATIGVPELDRVSIQMLRDLKAVINRLKTSGRFSGEEVIFIQSAFHIFFEEYLLFRNIFKNRKVANLLFFPHYHREGIIAAATQLGIQTLELQHGLIAENDLYYAYPEYAQKAADNAFFADRILLFGEYWKNIILRGHEYPADKIRIVGDFTFLAQEQEGSLEKENIIFIGAQKNMARPFVEYTQALLKILEQKHPDWRILLKMHPLEGEKELYESIDHPQFHLIGNEGNLAQILRKSRIQISIYSTTFFDALGLNVVNFSLQNYSSFSDYAADMLREKVAFPLTIDEDPIEKMDSLKLSEEELLRRNEVYAPFDKPKLQQLLKAPNA